ncbi:hypothetical protein [Streptomyces sp. NPDC057557]|uniref:hypothetical protein n=1 Tax=Streptomyces sp. NPDC057557 TaxID=3346167 RepID=UPI00368145A4
MHEAREQQHHRTRLARLTSQGTLLYPLALAALLPLLVAVWVGSSTRKLITGESATVRTVTECVEGGAQQGPSHCYGSWAFGDGRTAAGEIGGAKVSAGDTIFAGNGWAYDSTSPLHWQIWVPVTLFGAALVVLAAAWLNHRRNPGKPSPG